jgi:PAS domain S-box-containing protein
VPPESAESGWGFFLSGGAAVPASWDASARMLRARRRHLRTAVWLLCLLLLGVAFGLSSYEHVEFRHGAMAQAELYARVIEGHATRTITSVGGTLRVLSESPLLRAPDYDAPAVSQLLGEQLHGQPSLRSLAVVDTQGRILSSSTASDLARRIDLLRLVRSGAGGTAREWLGPLLPVRDLGDLALSQAPTLGAVGLPLVRRVERESGQELWLVALLNGDYFATQHDLAVADTPLRPLVTDLQGQLVSTSEAELRPGQSLAQLPPFRRWLPQREHGSYIDEGSDGSVVVGAFRASRQWPLVVLVEQPYAQVRQQWLERSMLFAAVAMSVCLLLAVLGLVADRGMRREREAQRRLLAAHDEIGRNQERFRATFEQAAVGMLERNPDGRLLRVNAALCTLLGYTEAEMLSLNAESLVHPDDYAASLLNIRRLFNGEIGSLTQEKRYRRKDGRYVWVRLNASLLVAMRGEPIGGDDQIQMVGHEGDAFRSKMTFRRPGRSASVCRAISRRSCCAMLAISRFVSGHGRPLRSARASRRKVTTKRAPPGATVLAMRAMASWRRVGGSAWMVWTSTTRSNALVHPGGSAKRSATR